MPEIWLIDGYNVLGAMYDGQGIDSLADARDALADTLADFAGTMGIRCLLVFDAHKVKGGMGSQDDVCGLTVIYTKAEETADSCIERMCAQYVAQGNVVRICTNDAMIQHVVLGLGGLRMSVRELLMHIQQAIRERNQRPSESGNQRLFKTLDARILAKLERLRIVE